MSTSTSFRVADDQLILQRVWAHERDHPDRLYMTQPLAGGRVDTYTWARTIDEARRLAAFLRAHKWPAESRVALVSKNCAQHFIFDLAVWMAGHIPVAIYPTVDADTLRYTLEHCDAQLVFLGKLDDWPALEPGVPEGVQRVRCDLSPAVAGALEWSDLLAEYAPIPDQPLRDREATSMLVYTSGSTGTPKGVEISFAGICAFAYAIDAEFSVTAQDRMMSYLPLAHALERSVVEVGSFCLGFQVFFAESLDTFLDDVKRAEPTIFLSVPRLWLKLKAGVEAKIKPKRLRTLLATPVVGALMRKKILGQLGLGKARFGATGSAPIPVEVLDWYAHLGLDIINGFGMTELSGATSATRLGRPEQRGTVGPALPGSEMRVRDGELQVRSVGMMKGYYRAPELTAEAFTEDGWLRTGDQATLDADGCARITGRVKELFKTSKGKYVAPAPIEGKLNATDHIEQSCVMGLGLPQPIAVVMLTEPSRAKLANGGRAAVLADLSRAFDEVNAVLPKHERLDNIVVTRDDWQINNGMLTPTMKIKRSAIEARYQHLLAQDARAPGVRVDG